MKFNKTLVASATTAALGMAAGNAQALNLGEVWAMDQIGGFLHIWKQSDLNNPFTDAPAQIIDLTGNPEAAGQPNAGNLIHSSVRSHIVGFSNHAGIDPASRSVQAFLGGWMEVWKTNGGPAAPTKIVSLEASTINAYGEEGLGAPDKGNTVHACGFNAQNDQMQCASIFNGDFSLFDADLTTDTYSRIGIWRLGDVPVDPGLKPGLANKVNAALADMFALDPNPDNLCAQYSTDGNLLYHAVKTGLRNGGVIVMDVSDKNNPTILDAYADNLTAGCALVNHPDGKHLWINHGFNRDSDGEAITIWKYKRAGRRHGPVDRVDFDALTREPVFIQADGTPDPTGQKYSGDSHGMQFAGLTNSFAWNVMRVDDTIEVVKAIDSKGKGSDGTYVNRIDTRAKSGRSAVAPDVIDRSQLGTKMYWTTRGPIPTTAIGNTALGQANKFYNPDRLPGVDVYGTLFGYDGKFVKFESMDNAAVTSYLCDGDAIGVPSAYPVACAAGDPTAQQVSAVDPHGLKSLNYLTGF